MFIASIKYFYFLTQSLEIMVLQLRVSMPRQAGAQFEDSLLIQKS
jgi:hypothetical protein